MAASARPRLCLGDLLAEEAFGLVQLSGGEEAVAREVHGAHAVEVEEPERWLARDWVMLTTGVRLRGSAGAQRALVDSLESAGVAALGFGVGLAFKRVPPALLARARERGFPIFTVPYETPFREIVRFVETALSAGDEQVFRRLTALQRYLVDALRTPDPERAIVDRLAQFLDAGVMVLDADGEPEVVAGRPPVAALRRELQGRPGGMFEFDVDGWHAVAAPVATGAEAAERWLVLATPRPGLATQLAKPAAEATTPLLAAMARLGDVVRDQEQAVKAALLAEALEPVGPRDLLPLAARAAAFGVDFSTAARMIVVRRRARRPPARAAPDLGAVRREVVAVLEQARVPHLVQQRTDALTALIQGGDEEIVDALGPLLESRPDVRVGIGRAVSAIADAHHSLRDAELAVAHSARGSERRMMRFEDFDLGAFVVSEIAPERLGPKVDEILSVLHANPPLHEALTAYFAHDLDVAASAQSLHMHRNSLRYRLARVEQLLGRSLRQPATIAAIYIALAADAAARDRAG